MALEHSRGSSRNGSASMAGVDRDGHGNRWCPRLSRFRTHSGISLDRLFRSDLSAAECARRACSSTSDFGSSAAGEPAAPLDSALQLHRSLRRPTGSGAFYAAPERVNRHVCMCDCRLFSLQTGQDEHARRGGTLQDLGRYAIIPAGWQVACRRSGRHLASSVPPRPTSHSAL